MMPDGVSKMLLPSHMGAQLMSRTRDGRGRTVLELGMGSGKVALQIFLQCPCVETVIGVELVQSRYDIGKAALKRLQCAQPERFSISEGAGVVALTELTSQRSIRFHCG